MDPLQRRLDPTEVARPRVVEHSQAHKVDFRRHPGVRASVAADDSAHVRAVRSVGTVVVRVGVALGEVPAADHAIVRAKPASQRDVVPGNPTVNHRHRLPVAGKSEVTLDLGETGTDVGVR